MRVWLCSTALIEWIFSISFVDKHWVGIDTVAVELEPNMNIILNIVSGSKAYVNFWLLTVPLFLIFKAQHTDRVLKLAQSGVRFTMTKICL